MKIQDVGVGNYIRSPRGRKTPNSRGMSTEVMQVAANNGNSFLCYPVTSFNAGPNGPEPVLDTTRYIQIPIDSNVEKVSP